MPGVGRLGDLLDTGGRPPAAISQGSGDVFANNIPVARDGDGTTGHPDSKGADGYDPVNIIATNGSNVFANNILIAVGGDLTEQHVDNSPGPNNIHVDIPHTDAVDQVSGNVNAG